MQLNNPILSFIGPVLYIPSLFLWLIHAIIYLAEPFWGEPTESKLSENLSCEKSITMRLRNVPKAAGIIESSSFAIKEPESFKGRWSEVFGNNNPIRIEIGMGKGRFITELAATEPNINYIGIEKYASVMFKAVEKLEKKEVRPSNIVLVLFDADRITDLFDSEEIDRIYLNFSDPWPKSRHAQRRLTSERFLKKYEQFLKKDGVVEFKTDNTGLFDFSVESAKEAGWRLDLVEYDLHNSAFCEGNIMTEYEEKFSLLGNPIHKMVIGK